MADQAREQKVTEIQSVIAEKFEPENLDDMAATNAALPAMFMPQSMGELMEFAKLMALTSSVPPHLRAKPADCLAVAMAAFRWQMDPFAVANKTYFVNDRIAFEAQLVDAVLNTRAPLEERLSVSWEGEGNNMECTVTGRFRGDSEPKSRTVKISTITTRNSPLWKQDPQQQLAYYTKRAWARLYCPEVLLGVYAEDELADSKHQGPDRAKDVTPRPRRSDYRASLGDSAEAVGDPDLRRFDIFDHYGETIGVYTPGPWTDRYAELALLAARDGRAALDSFIENNAATVAIIIDEKLVTPPEVVGEALAAAVKTLATDVADEPATSDDGKQPKPEPEQSGPSYETLMQTGRMCADEGTGSLRIWWENIGTPAQHQLADELDGLRERAADADHARATDQDNPSQESIPFDAEQAAE